MESMVKVGRENLQFSFGFPEAQRQFATRYPQLLKDYVGLGEAQNIVLSAASRKMKNLMRDKIIYLLARQAYEDFDEIMLLCANGLSTGGMKILRGLFERTVTVCYLQKKPEEIERYYKYFYVRRRKEANAIKPDFPNVISSAMNQTIETEYEAVKALFQVPVCEVCRVESCKACKRQRDNFSWTRKSIIHLARETGDFEAVIYHGYYLPMQETHATAEAATHRIKPTEDGKWEYVEGSKPELDALTLMVSHFLVIRAIEVLGLHFEMRVKGLISNLWRDFFRTWQLRKGRGARKVRQPK
jgi:hypothetical protein